MHLQYLTDDAGNKTAVLISIEEWLELKSKYHIEEREIVSEDFLKNFMDNKQDSENVDTNPTKDVLKELREEGEL